MVGTESPTVPWGSRGNGLFLRKTVHELIFGFTWETFGVAFSGAAGRLFPSPAIMQATNPRPGPHRINTGKADRSKYGQYVSWKGLTAPLATASQLPWTMKAPACFTQIGQVVPGPTYQGHRKDCKVWNEPEEMRYSGNGMFYGSLFNENDDPKPVRMTVSSVYRKADLVFKRKEEIKGVKVWRYILDDNLLKITHPTAANYWMTECNGLIPLRSATGAPLYVSLPGFGGVEVNGGDGSVEECTGVTVDGGWDQGAATERHETYIHFDPLSGMALGYRQRLQASVQLESSCVESPSNDGPFCNNFVYAMPSYGLYDYYSFIWQMGTRNKLFVPFYWAEEEKDLSDDDASAYTDKVYFIRDLGSYLLYSMIPVGTVIMIASVVILLLRLRAPIIAASSTTTA
jgi:hypothetical protein